MIPLPPNAQPLEMPLLALLLACSDYKLDPQADAAPFDTGEPPHDTADTADTAPPPPEEVCNGLDDDGDGAIDEGFPDTDGDGTADCVDDACVTTPASPRSERRDTCDDGAVVTPIPDPWTMAVLWTWEGGTPFNTPTVGDLDQDGTPEVVVTTSDRASLVVLDGRTGAEEWRYEGGPSYSSATLGDLDGDGLGDIVLVQGTCGPPVQAVAFDAWGNEMWRRSVSDVCQISPTLADLDGDGTVEVIVADFVLDGATGDLEIALPLDPDTVQGGSVVADLDLDGHPEILVDNQVFDADGTPRFSCGAQYGITFANVMNLDDDPYGEVAVGALDKLTVCDDDGTVLWTWIEPYRYNAPVTAADFDGDGAWELFVANNDLVSLLGADGTARWSRSLDDPSGLAGGIAWDVDQDGTPEIIYADQEDVYILDGRTGATLAVDGTHRSPTGTETPAVADVDGDGDGEIVTLSTEAPAGIVVHHRPDGPWAAARPTYASQTFSGDDIGDDLVVPPYADPPWVGRGRLFRGQPSALAPHMATNLAVAIADACVARCDPGGVATVELQVWNDGQLPAPADTLVRLYGHPGGARTLLAELPLGERLYPGQSHEWTVPVDGGSVGALLEAVVDEDDTVTECDAGDDRSAWSDGLCP